MSRKIVHPGRALVRRLVRFADDGDGSMIILSLFLLVLMLMVGGMAVDTMRFENTRTRLQATIDRAVLAAANLNQTLPAADVVRDYLTRAGLINALVGDPSVQQGLNYKVVSAQTRLPVQMFFMNMMGINQMTAPAASTAEERVTNVEVSLVLDMSSSMQNNNKLSNLRTAAKSFVSTVLANNAPGSQGLTTISIVPYSAVVNIGPDMAAYYPLSSQHDMSYCPLIGANEVTDTWIDTAITRNRVSDFDYGAETNTNASPIQRPWCFKPTENAITIDSSNESSLRTKIQNLVSFGNTAIDLGVKWGVSLLDPRSQPMVTGLIGAGKVEAASAGRPFSFTAPDTLKVLVVMTDGENTQEYDLAEPYKSGLSTIWVNKAHSSDTLGGTSNNRFSILVSDNNTPNNFTDDTFFWLGQSYYNRIHNYPQGFPDYTKLNGESAQPGQGIDYSSTVRHLSWQDVYSNWVRTVIYSNFFYEPYRYGYISYNTYVATYYALETVMDSTPADNRLSATCDAAKAKGIVIYTVAFEASSHGKSTLLDCASSPSHYFDVQGTNISVAFAAIASDIAKLKLTQ
ncbi:MAG: hypothetical protein GC146_02645 [Limimaricola sp.]|uniref:Tad domain-containing protein n=1 Tax=Limimaricola sp. TaxID=2211665 RepID=UPI001D47E2A5|nr:Tad domain-containing protein [Limimaricola sp.]MBI1416098.1 hypothetical protein [Limimaricola sp.]